MSKALLAWIPPNPSSGYTAEWIASVKVDMDRALAAVSAQLLREMYPIFFGPMTREEDAGFVVYLLLQMTGAYGTVYSEEEDSESEEDYY